MENYILYGCICMCVIVWLLGVLFPPKNSSVTKTHKIICKRRRNRHTINKKLKERKNG